MRPIVVTALALAVVGCGISKEEYAAKEAESQKYQAALADESGKTAALEAKVSDLTAQLKSSQEQLQTAQEQLQSSQAELSASQTKASELAAKSEQYEQLAQSLKGQIDAGQIELTELRGRVTVKLKDRILFASGSASIGKEGKVALDAVADAFKDLSGKYVLVAGYTDDVPVGKAGFKDNWDLSSARAAAVVRYLQSKGVDPRMLGVAGFSEYRPVAPNDSPANRSLNRRIEIALTAADFVPIEGQ